MALRLVLPALVGIACGIRSSPDLADQDVLLSLEQLTAKTQTPEGGIKQHEKEFKWLLLMKKGLAEARVQELRGIDRLGFYAQHVGVWEYLGTKDHLERDLSRMNLKDDVSHHVMDVEMGLVPETPDAHASTPPAARWGLELIGAGGSTLSGQGIRTFVFDTGIDETHPDFEGRVIREFDMTIIQDGNDAEGRDTGSCRELDLDICGRDEHGHGTHVAGAIAGKDVGVAPGATLHAVKVASKLGKGQLSWVVRGFNHMLSRANLPREGFGSQTLIASLGLRAKTTSTILESVVDTAAADGVVVVVAAGNRADDACSYTPANVAAAFTVGAINQKAKVPSFSNYGRCIDLFAPGVSVETLALTGGKLSRARATGTSMALPHVAGAMAVFLEENPALQPAELKALVLSRALEQAIPGDLHGSPNKILCIDRDSCKAAHLKSQNSYSGPGAVASGALLAVLAMSLVDRLAVL